MQRRPSDRPLVKAVCRCLWRESWVANVVARVDVCDLKSGHDTARQTDEMKRSCCVPTSSRIMDRDLVVIDCHNERCLCWKYSYQ